MPDDRLERLTILQQSKSAEFDSYLGSVQKSAQTNAAEVYGVSAWMISHGLASDALRWLTNCPPKLRAEQPVPLALVDCYLAQKDWAGLDTYLDGQKWTDLEFLRFAFLSRTAAEQNQRMGAEARWRTAVREAGDRLGPLTALLNMATAWGRGQAREDLLWQIAQRFPRERWALRELEAFVLGGGKHTWPQPGLYRNGGLYAQKLRCRKQSGRHLSVARAEPPQSPRNGKAALC